MGAQRGLTDAALDRASPVPLYYQLAESLETAIRSGSLSSGSHLENEIELARQLRVSRPTVRRAIAVLANRGLVIRRHGIGTLVVRVRVRRPVRLSSLYDDLTQSGQAPTTRLLAYEVVPAPLEVANSLQLSEGTRVLHFERLRLATGQPISLMRNFLPLALKEVVTEEGLKLTGLYRLLRHSGIHLRPASHAIGGRSAQPRDALFLIAADRPARGVLKVGADPMAMADRGELLRRLLTALGRPGVDGILGTADIIDDLALLGALDGKVVFGSMNRGGLTGFRFELDDRFTAYTAEGIVAAGLDGGKMMVRVADEPDALRTLAACAHAINELSARKLPAMIEVFASEVEDGRVRNRADADSLIGAITIVSGLGTTSAYIWLKLPVVNDLERVMRATSLPTLLLGGDPGEDPQETFGRWRRAMSIPQVRGLLAGPPVH